MKFKATPTTNSGTAIIIYAGTAACGNAALALGVDDGRFFPLLFGHGIDHGLDAVKGFIVDLAGVDAGSTGQHATGSM